MPEKKLLVCIIAIDTLPSFFRDNHYLEPIINEGHTVALFCPTGTEQLIESWKSAFSDIRVVGFNDTQSGLIKALCAFLDDNFNWQRHDIVLVNNTDCTLDAETLKRMQERMNAFDRYSLGNPRMNSDGWVELKERDAHFAQKNLPAITRMPYPISSCVYIKGLQYATFGPLDVSYSTLDAALCDYAIRINEYGFDSLMLNHIFVKISDNGDFIHAYPAISEADYKKLKAAHEYIDDAIVRFEFSGKDPVNRFIPIINADKNRRPSVLLDFSNMPAVHVGTSEYQIGLLKRLSTQYGDKYDLHVYVSASGGAFHNISQYTDNIYLDERDLGVYDIGVYAAQPTEIVRQIITDRHCARMIYTMLDSILLRCDYIDFAHSSAIASVESVRCGLENCDGIVCISDYSQKDMLDYFQDDAKILSKPNRRIYIATDFGEHAIEGPSVSLDGVIPFDDYILLAGNPWFKHKALANAIEILKDMDESFIVLGYGDDEYLHPNVYGCSYGLIDENTLVELYRKCKAFVFPSVYEGFGLPIVNALKCNKVVVLNDNPLNRELAEHLGATSNDFVFFNTFSELPAAVAIALEHKSSSIDYRDSWDAFASEFVSFMDELLEKPIDLDFLRSRHRQYAAHWQMLARKQREIDEDLPLETIVKTRLFRKIIMSNPKRLDMWRKIRSGNK